MVIMCKGEQSIFVTKSNLIKVEIMKRVEEDLK